MFTAICIGVLGHEAKLTSNNVLTRLG